MLKLKEQNQLINQNSTQNNQLGAFQTLHRNLATPFRYILEQAIEGFNRLVMQDMKDATNIDTSVGMRVWITSRTYQQSIIKSRLIAKLRYLVMILQQYGNE